MTRLLEGDRALVTGAGRGIGRAIATELAAHGCAVVVNDVDREAADDTAAALQAEYDVRSASFPGDVASVDDVDRMVDETVDAFGGLDVLVNNAAVASPQRFEELDAETWQRTLDVNLTGVKNCTAAAFPALRESEDGRIVNVASIAGLRISLLMGAHYTSSKWGVIGFTKHVAYEGGEYGIRANAVCPGPTETPLTTELTTEEERADTEEEIPLGRWASPEDVAGATVFFASELSSHVTGTALPVDGGFIIR